MTTHIGGVPPGNEKAPQVTTLEGHSTRSVVATTTNTAHSVTRRADDSRGDGQRVSRRQVIVWGVVEVDLSPHADPHGFINHIPHTAFPYPPPGSLLRIRIGDVYGVSKVVLYQLAETIPDGCKVEVCGSRGDAVANVVTGLRAAFSHAEGAA
jgi:hypothetical protein